MDLTDDKDIKQRDKFAAAALSALIASGKHDDMAIEDLALRALLFADYMMNWLEVPSKDRKDAGRKVGFRLSSAPWRTA